MIACVAAIVVAAAFDSASTGAVAATPLAFDVRADFDRALADFDEAHDVQARHPDRARHLFESSAQRFAAIASAGVVSGPLEFNLGNAYLEAGDLGLAILHYRRAERLMPTDERLRQNLGVARSRCLTALRPTGRSVFLEGLFFWHFQTTKRARLFASIGFYAAFWLFLAIRRMVVRRWMAIAALLCGALTLACAGSLGYDTWSNRRHPPGVITVMDVPVYSGYAASYDRQFEQPLQPGVEFTVLDRHGDWWRVELPDGQSGWIESSQGALIPRDPV